jgi:hypothetical protein
VEKVFDLSLFALVAIWPITLPAIGLLVWSLARIPAEVNPYQRKAIYPCFGLLGIGPASVIVSVAIGHNGLPAQWPPWVDWFVPSVLAINLVLGVLLLFRARRARFTSSLVVIASLLLTMAFACSGTMALTGVGP